MRVVVVGTEKDLTQLRTRVVRSGVPETRLRSVEASIRAANPHLDLDRLRPGAVVVLPDHPDVEAEAAGGAPAMLAAVGAALPKAHHVVRRGAEAAVTRGDELAEALADADVTRAAAADADLRAEVTRLTAAVADERRRAREWADAMNTSMARWQAAAEELRRLT
jgi:hypothetical protein